MTAMETNNAERLEHYKVQARAAMFEELVKALDRLHHSTSRFLNGKPVRDMDESLSEAVAVLARAAALK